MAQPADPSFFGQIWEKSTNKVGGQMDKLGEGLAQMPGPLGLLARMTQESKGPLKALAPALYVLNFALRDVMAAQKKLTQAFVITGRAEELTSFQMVETMNNMGVSFSEAAHIIQGSFAKGIRGNQKQVAATMEFIAAGKLIGANSEALTETLIKTRDVLGLSNQASIEFGTAIIETGAQYGIHTDILVGAINGLIGQLKQTQASVGPAMVAAVQTATTQLIGKFGAGMTDNIKSVMTQLFGGGKASSMLALRLGIPLGELTKADPENITKVVTAAIQSSMDKTGGIRGGEAAGLIVPALQKTFGFGPEFLILGDNMNRTLNAQEKIALEELKWQQLQHDLSAQMTEIVRPFKIAVLRILNLISKPLAFIAHGIGKIVGVLSIMLPLLIAIAVGSMVNKLGSAFQGAGAAGGSLQTMKALGGTRTGGFFGGKLMGMFSKSAGFLIKWLPWIGRGLSFIGRWIFPIAGAVLLIVDIYKFFSNRAEEQRSDLLENSKKLTNHLIGEKQSENLQRLAMDLGALVMAMDNIAVAQSETTEVTRAGLSNVFDGIENNTVQTSPMDVDWARARSAT